MTNLDYKIRKAKLVKDLEWLEAEYDIQELNEEKVFVSKLELKATIKKRAHPDLVEAFKSLTPHLYFLTEMEDDARWRAKNPQAELKDVFDLTPVLGEFKVTSFSIGGYDEHEGVTITGQKKLKSGKILNLNTPFTKWIDENSPYGFSDDLFRDVQVVIGEIKLYLNGKIHPEEDNQLVIDFKPAA